MGKPRLIILIRHAQSEGNKAREIHQTVPDHRVKLTDDGWRQAEEAGRRLRTLLKPEDTLQIFTSPYRRTRETTEGILKTLTSKDEPVSDDSGSATPPAPAFSRSRITVYEEPRIREQDFGNFQPCSAEMNRMWQERADYGHFFYRIPSGESAADAYDRVSGFNESLWRQFNEPDFPSVCVLVTHGLMTRVFLMKWYHWSVEYFEDLRNMNHCEFVLMKMNDGEGGSGKYVLENQLRTWSELKRQKAEAKVAMARQHPQRRNTLSSYLKPSAESPVITAKKWGGCAGGCDHDHSQFPRRTNDWSGLPAAASRKPSVVKGSSLETAATTGPEGSGDATSDATPAATETRQAASISLPVHPKPLIDSAGSSGANTPHEQGSENEADYFPSQPALSSQPSAASLRKRLPKRQPTQDDISRWTQESGMGRGEQADTLGDGEEDSDGGGGPVDRMEERDERHIEEEVEREERSVGGSVY